MNAHTLAEALTRVTGLFVDFGGEDFGSTSLLHVQGSSERHVLVLVDVLRAADGTLGRIFAGHGHVTVGTVPDGDSVSPPELAADAPVLDVAHPVVVGVLPVVRHEADAPVLHRGDGRSGQGRDAHVPLIGEIGLDDDI